MKYEVLDIEQGSSDWLKLKQTHLGASCCPVLMEESEYHTPYTLWKLMLTGENEVKPFEPALQRGHDLEEIARKEHEQQHNITLIRPVIRSLEHPFLIASLDALTPDHSQAYEIKAVKLEYHEMTYKKKIPRCFYGQCQQQMFLLNHDVMEYISIHPDVQPSKRKTYTEVKFDSDYIESYLEKAYKFMDNLNLLIAPELLEREKFQDLTNDEELDAYTDEFFSWHEIVKQATEQKEHWHKVIIEHCNKKNAISKKVKILKVTSKGQVNYKKIPELEKVDLDLYRNPSIESFRITRD